MLLTPHTLVGITIASSISNPFISVPLSFAMHFFGDKVPHWDFFSGVPMGDRVKGWRIFAVMVDLTLAVATGLTFTYYALWAKNNSYLAVNIFLSSIASCLPDALEVPMYYFDSNNFITRSIYAIQHRMQSRADLPWGALSQVVVGLACLLLLSGSLLQG